MPHLSLNKKDSGVSSVIGTITLLVLVVVATGIIAVNVVSNIGDTAQQGPIVSFEESADPTLLYHAGGDVLYWDKTIIYCNGEDITNLTYVGSYLNAISQLTTDAKRALDEVSDWSTGQFIRPFNATTSSVNSNTAIKVSEILIVSVEGGKPVVLYSGSEYKGGEKEEGYKINVSTTGSGTVIDCPSRATAGTSISFTVTGGERSVIILSGTDDYVIEPTVSVNTYTFTMPSSDVRIFVDFTTAEYPYFRWGQNNSTGYDTEYTNAKDLIEAINAWQPGTIIQTKYTDDDNAVSGVLAKNIPLENQSLVIKTGWNINLTASSLNNISASPAHDKGVPLIVVQDHGSFNVYNGELVLDGAGRMKDSVVRVISGGNLTTKYEDAVLNINNGYNSSKTVGAGGGIYNEGTVNGKISVINCKAVNGGGIYNEGKLTLLSGGVIYGNVAQGVKSNIQGMGGGICNYGDSAFADINCNILFNNATSSGNTNTIASGGGIANLNGATLRVQKDAGILNNLAKYRGGGIYTVNGGKTYIHGALISSNHASAGGGIHNHYLNRTIGEGNSRISETYIYEGTIIRNNVVGEKTYSGFSFNDEWSGGGIYNDANLTFLGGEIVISHNNCTSNNNDQGGGGIANAKQTTANSNNIVGKIMIENGASVIVTDNYAIYGGGIFVKSSNPDINVSVLNNTAKNDGGGVYVYDESANINGVVSNNTAKNDGGGVYVNNGTAYVNKTLSNNNATNGGGIYMNSGTVYVNETVSNNNATNGGGIYMNSGTVYVNGTVSNNTAKTSGGGIYSDGPGSRAKVIIETNGKVMFNTAVKNGGGISFSYGDVIVNGSVYNNTVKSKSPALSWNGLGGGIFINHGTLVMNSGKIYNNSALTIDNNNQCGMGGGIYTGQSDDTLTINGNSEVSNNTATNYGGGILSKGTATVSSGSVLTMNYNKARIGNKYGSAINVMSDGNFTNSGNITGTGNAVPQVVPIGSIGGYITWQ